MRSRLQSVTCWALFVARVATAESSWQVEHALGDTDFVAAGSLTDGTQGLQWTRSSGALGLTEELEQLINQGGYYKVRVSASDSRPIQASLPARCLEKGEKLVAVTSVSGELTALSYDLSQAECNPSHSTGQQSAASLAKIVPVTVMKPARATAIKQQPKPLASAKPGARSAPAAAQKASVVPGQGKKDKVTEGDGGEAAPPPLDNRSWIQKNWIFLIPAALMLVNTFGGAQQRARAAPGPAAQPRPRQSR
ncbi:hypothetical protein CVIRNUC_004936 [Coccomyxa viridis]|uniref:ER membrane protein complex subunit 10 n=1 Tax=Coccomyxa viridis TaxID=1274662 RepID=A0AAV1I362_9CHLO|nr:hypothetical protein CVIRNUC_004936 [Coccomyxa viridis]